MPEQVPLTNPNPTSKLRLLKATRIPDTTYDCVGRGHIFEAEVYNAGVRGYFAGTIEWYTGYGQNIKVTLLADIEGGYSDVELPLVPPGQVVRVLTEHLSPWPPSPHITAGPTAHLRQSKRRWWQGWVC